MRRHAHGKYMTTKRQVWVFGSCSARWPSPSGYGSRTGGIRDTGYKIRNTTRGIRIELARGGIQYITDSESEVSRAEDGRTLKVEAPSDLVLERPLRRRLVLFVVVCCGREWPEPVSINFKIPSGEAREESGRTAPLPVDVRLPLVRGNRAEDDVHLLQRAALGLGDEAVVAVLSADARDRRKRCRGTYRAKVAIPPMLIVANIRKILYPRSVTSIGVTFDKTKSADAIHRQYSTLMRFATRVKPRTPDDIDGMNKNTH